MCDAYGRDGMRVVRCNCKNKQNKTKKKQFCLYDTLPIQK